ncbi:DUF935 domain-containing protein [Taklimakanibacter albus]|uniref:DUF935 domain-containing protein n=1 Tax=Taklimakanibacter albus TaxID=2800327 RepID=UPI003B96987F
MAQILKDAAGDDPDDFLGMAEEMEELDPHYGSVLRTRKLAISSIEAEIVAASEDAKDQEIAKFAREIVDAPNFPDLLADCLDGLGKGYAVCAIEWDTSKNLWKPENYVWRDPRSFRWDRATRTIKRRLADGSLVDLDPGRYVTHVPRLKSGAPVRGALARLASWSFLFKNYTVKDWVRFIEVYGMPLRVGKYGPNANEDDKRNLLRALANIGTDAAGIIPNTMNIDFVQTGAGTAAQGPVFGQFADYLDKQISKGVLGQTMTTDDGASRAQSEVHNEVRLDIKAVDARQLAASIQKSLIIPACALNFGMLEKYPTFRLPVEEPEDLKAWTANVTEFMDRGLPVSRKQIREKIVLDEPIDEADALVGRAPRSSLEPDDEIAPRSRKARAHRSDCPCCGGKAIALATSEGQDSLDEIVAAALADDAMDGLVEPVLAAARGSRSFDEFMTKLTQAAGEMDAASIITRLGEATFKARGLGSATDDPQA